MYTGSGLNQIGYFYHSVSADNGSNWSSVSLGSTVLMSGYIGIHNDIVVIGSRVYMSSIGGSITSPVLRLAKSIDDGVTW